MGGGKNKHHRQTKSPGGFPPGLSIRSLDRTYQLR
jgi:hypothetical protein